MAKEPSEPATNDSGHPAAVASTTTTPNEPVENRKEHAHKLVDRFAIWSGAAGGIPVPIVDLVALGTLQLQMLRRLSQIYDLPFAENRGKALITALIGTAIPTSSGLGAAQLLKAIPIFGTILSMLITPTLAAGLTYAIGRVFVQHFESGGTLLDFNPPDYREFLKGQRDMWTSRKDTAPHSDASATGS